MTSTRPSDRRSTRRPAPPARPPAAGARRAEPREADDVTRSDPHHGRRVRLGMPAMTAWKATLGSIVLFALLASGSLVKSARGQEEGWQRDVLLGTARGIDRVSNLLALNRPLDWANGLLDREDVEPAIEFPPVTVAPPSTPSTTLPRIVSATDPLRVGIYGDSQAKDLGRQLIQLAAGDPLMTWAEHGRVSTGLARPDYYNWPARLQELLATEDRDVIVFMTGSNDSQTLQDREGNAVAAVGTPEWEEEYRRRVAGLMDLVNNGRHRLVWVTVPLVGNSKLAPTMALINRIIRDQAATRSWVTVADAEPLLAGPNGEYVDYITPDGKAPARCRRSDHVHLTLACLDILAEHVLGAFRDAFPRADATTTTVPSASTTAPSNSEEADQPG